MTNIEIIIMILFFNEKNDMGLHGDRSPRIHFFFLFFVRNLI